MITRLKLLLFNRGAYDYQEKNPAVVFSGENFQPEFAFVGKRIKPVNVLSCDYRGEFGMSALKSRPEMIEFWNKFHTSFGNLVFGLRRFTSYIYIYYILFKARLLTRQNL